MLSDSDDGSEIFVHTTSMRANAQNVLREGDHVRFNIVRDSKGKGLLEAVEVNMSSYWYHYKNNINLENIYIYINKFKKIRNLFVAINSKRLWV